MMQYSTFVYSIYCCTLCDLIFLDEDCFSSFGLCFLLLKTFQEQNHIIGYLMKFSPGHTSKVFLNLEIQLQEQMLREHFGTASL